MLCPIDNDEGQEEAGGKVNYNELEDEEDINLKLHGAALPSSSAVLPVDEDNNKVDLCLDELAEILADGPIQQLKKHKVAETAAIAKDKVDHEDGSVFELNDWV